MKQTIRIINGNSGGAIAVRSSDGKERKFAIFPDANVNNFVEVGGKFCVLVSSKSRIALFDIHRQ